MGDYSHKIKPAFCRSRLKIYFAGSPSDFTLAGSAQRQNYSVFCCACYLSSLGCLSLSAQSNST